jgi:hypothetical protein
MYAMIRHYRMGTGSVADLMRKVDTQFVDRLQTALDILGYQAIDAGDRRLITVTLFDSEEQCRRAQEAADGVRSSLAEFLVEQVGAYHGEVMVARGSKHLLTAVHP